MSAPFYDIQSKAEAALAALVQAALTAAADTTAVYAGLGTIEVMASPRVVCTVDAGPEDPIDTGNFWLDFTALVVSLKDPNDGQTAAAALTAHRQRVALVFDAIKTTTTALDLTSNGPADFTCQGVKDWTMPAQTSQDRQIETSMSFSGYCCASDLAP